MKFLIAILALVAPLMASAQSASQGLVFLDAVPFAGQTADTASVDVYVAIPYNAITYERKGTQFVGRYQAQIRIEGGDNVWLDTTFVRTVRAANYEATNGEHAAYEFYQQRVMLPQGSYTAAVDLLDLRSNLHSTLTRNVTVADYRTPRVALSGLLVVQKIREDSGRYIITPMITESVPAGANGYFLFFETYNNGDSVECLLRVVYRDNLRVVGAPLSFTKTFPAGRSQQWIRMPAEGMPRGSFTVDVQAFALGDTSRAVATTRRMIRLEGTATAIALAEEELDARVTQLRYVGTQSVIEDIRSAASLADRQRKFGEFWLKLDPTPGTVANEAMDEYYRRIDYADEHFRSYAAGWLTDKGRVYVLYGQPDNISSDPFRSDGKVIETWQYFRRSIRCTFIDDSGFGDFRLTTPLPSGEKYRYAP